LAKPLIPDPLNRRFLLEKNLSKEKFLEIAEAYVAEGREIDALDFFARAEVPERLLELREEAIQRGDGFLLRSICGLSKEEPTREEWTRLVEVAEAKGMLRYAETARRQATVASENRD